MMGIFTLYTGFLYNVFFSKSIILTTPYWKNTFDRETIENNHYIELNPVFETNPPYIFGVDPVWAVIFRYVKVNYESYLFYLLSFVNILFQLAKNKIMYLNSLKMKLSIIIGIIHMMFGLSLSLFNHL